MARERRRGGRWVAAVVIGGIGVGVVGVSLLEGQERRRATRTQAVVDLVELPCLAELGVGVSTQRQFCHVRAGRDPAGGIILDLPPHRGPLTLTFDLHNKHTYSEAEVRAKRGYALYTATIGVLTLDNFLISRAVVQSEFRTAADLFDRVSGGAGGTIKAVAPVGSEPIRMTIEEDVEAVSFLGEILRVQRVDGRATYSAPGQEIALVSNVRIEYTPR